MKTFWIVRTLFVVATLVTALSTAPADGQTSGRAVLVNIPFGFDAGTKHMEPGKYTITKDLNDFVWIKNGSSTAILMTRDEQGSRATEKAKLVFDRYGDRYFLRQVWLSPEDTAYLQCPESKTEKQAKESELAQNQKNASNVDVAMLRLP